MIRDIFFRGVTAPLRLDGADVVLPLLPEIVTGWPFRVMPAASDAPFFTITGTRGAPKLRCESHVEDRPPQDWDPVNAVCDAMAGLAIALPMLLAVAERLLGEGANAVLKAVREGITACNGTGGEAAGKVFHLCLVSPAERTRAASS